jgi:hypothetical protein
VCCMRSLENEEELHVLLRTCRTCFSRILSSRDAAVADYLESLLMPAALVARDQTVLSANGRFQGMAASREVVGLKLGEALECMYTPVLGACGDTVACLLCRLKRAVESTLLTGEGLRGASFSFPHKAEGRRSYSIVTEIVAGAVLLLMGTGSAET